MYPLSHCLAGHGYEREAPSSQIPLRAQVIGCSVAHRPREEIIKGLALSPDLASELLAVTLPAYGLNSSIESAGKAICKLW
jgi:hypothetical protein